MATPTARGRRDAPGVDECAFACVNAVYALARGKELRIEHVVGALAHHRPALEDGRVVRVMQAIAHNRLGRDEFDAGAWRVLRLCVSDRDMRRVAANSLAETCGLHAHPERAPPAASESREAGLAAGRRAGVA